MALLIFDSFNYGSKYGFITSKVCIFLCEQKSAKYNQKDNFIISYGSSIHANYIIPVHNKQIHSKKIPGSLDFVKFYIILSNKKMFKETNK